LIEKLTQSAPASNASNCIYVIYKINQALPTKNEGFIIIFNLLSEQLIWDLASNFQAF